MQLDLNGFFYSTEFLSQLAGFIVAILSAVFGSLVSGLFTTP
ncbi:MAG: hypothetical protein ACE5E5_05765 [Phycisphaerae bacterium]